MENLRKAINEYISSLHFCVPFQLEQMLTFQSGESDQESVYGTEQQRLREESRAYRFKLQAYQDSQQRQAQLVHKLQAKVTPSNITLHPYIFSKCIFNAIKFIWNQILNTVMFNITVWLLHCRCFSIKRDLEILSSRCWRKHPNWKSCVSRYDNKFSTFTFKAVPFTCTT